MKLEKENLTTKRDFEIFKSEALKCLKQYGLSRYDVNVTHKKLNGKLVVAECWFDHPSMASRVSLGLHWSDGQNKATEKELKQTAEHEVLELLLSKLCTLINLERYVRSEEIDEERHTIINAIINSR